MRANSRASSVERMSSHRRKDVDATLGCPLPNRTDPRYSTGENYVFLKIVTHVVLIHCVADLATFGHSLSLFRLDNASGACAYNLHLNCFFSSCIHTSVHWTGDC